MTVAKICVADRGNFLLRHIVEEGIVGWECRIWFKPFLSSATGRNCCQCHYTKEEGEELQKLALWLLHEKSDVLVNNKKVNGRRLDRQSLTYDQILRLALLFIRVMW